LFQLRECLAREKFLVSELENLRTGLEDLHGGRDDADASTFCRAGIKDRIQRWKTHQVVPLSQEGRLAMAFRGFAAVEKGRG
jgi:hypothetical protein